MQATQGDHEDQKEILDFLSRRLGAPEIVQTHISTVLLGEDRVFKVKRPVRLPYLDFSTRDRRLAMCEREIALNRRFSPGLYLGLRRVTREPDGGLALDGAGDALDHRTRVIDLRARAAGLDAHGHIGEPKRVCGFFHDAPEFVRRFVCYVDRHFGDDLIMHEVDGARAE